MFSKTRARIVVALIVAGVAVMLGRRVRLDSDLSRLLPDTNPELNRASVLLRRMLERTVVEIEGNGEDADRFAERLRPHVASVRAGVGEGDVLDLIARLRERAPRLIPDLDEVARRIEPARVKATLQTLARRLLEPDGAHLSARAPGDPLGLTDLALAPLAAFTAGLRDARIVDGRVVSADGKHMLLFVEPGFSAHDVDRTKAFLAAVEEAGAGMTVRFLGTHRATHDNAEQMESDVRLTAIAGFALVILLALGIFRRLTVALLAMLPAAFGAIVAFGVFSLFSDSIAAAVAGLAAVLLGITIDYAVHIFYSARVPARAILMGATTTAAAFVALRVSSLPGLREIGTVGALGICAAALFAIFLLPARRRRDPVDLGFFVRLLQKRAVFVALLVLTPLMIIGARKVSFDGDVQRMSKLSPRAAEDEHAITKRWGDAFRVTTLVVTADTLEEALQKNDALLGELEGKEHASLSGLLPSRRTQDARLKTWRAFWTGERVAGLRNSIAEGIEGTPFSKNAFDPFFEWLAADPPPVLEEDLPREFVRDRILDDRSVATPVFGADYEEFEELDDVLVINREALVQKLARMVGDETIRLGLAGLGVVALVVLAWMRNLVGPVLVLLPLLLSCVWAFGLLGWMGVPITLANAIFVAFLFGLAVDYSIFLMHGRLEWLRTGEDRVAETDSAVLLCALTTLAGFGVLTIAGHPVLHSIGVTALAGIGGAAVITQALMPRMVRRREATDVAGLFRYQGNLVSHYAASKAKRDPVVAAAPALCREAREVLAAGCGYGIVMANVALSGNDRRIRAIDLDAHKIAVARRAMRDLPHVEFVVSDLMTADLGAPDMVLAIDVLHYWSRKQQKELLARIAGAMPHGATMLFRDGCGDAKGHRWVHWFETLARFTRFTRAGGKFHFRTRDGWHNLMTECGLTVESERPDLGLSSNLVLICRKWNS